VRGSFVERHELGAGYERFRLHPVMREYVRGKAEAEAMAAHERRMARYFVALADWGGRQLNNPETALAAVGAAAIERENLLAAQEACLRLGMGDEAVSLAYDLNELFERSGHWADQRTVLEAGIEAAREAKDKADQAILTHNLAIVCQNTGEWRKAQELLLASLALKRQVGNEALGHPRRSDAATLYELGRLAQAQGDYPEARRLYGEAAETFEELGARREQAAVLHQLGTLAQAQGDYSEARRLYQESLHIKQQLGNRAGVAYTLGDLGNLALGQGNLDEARRLYQQVRGVSEEMGDRSSVAKALHQLGRLAQAQGDYPDARRLYQEAAETFDELGARREQAAVLHNLGALAQIGRDYPKARRLYQESLDIEQQLGNRAGVATSLHNLGMLAEIGGDYSEARRLYQESLDIAQQLGDRAGVALSLAQFALLEEREGNVGRALELARVAEGIFNELGSPNAAEARRVRERLEGSQENEETG